MKCCTSRAIHAGPGPRLQLTLIPVPRHIGMRKLTLPWWSIGGRRLTVVSPFSVN